MRHATALVTCLGAFFAVTFSATAGFSAEVAATEAKTEKKDVDTTRSRAFSIPRQIKLTFDQKEKLEGIKKEQAPKVAELTEKLDKVLTDDQKAARKDAVAKAKSLSLSRKDSRTSIEEAIKMTDDQRKRRSDLRSELRTLRQEIKGQINELLTPEQREYYKMPMSKKSV